MAPDSTENLAIQSQRLDIIRNQENRQDFQSDSLSARLGTDHILFSSCFQNFPRIYFVKLLIVGFF